MSKVPKLKAESQNPPKDTHYTKKGLPPAPKKKEFNINLHKVQNDPEPKPTKKQQNPPKDRLIPYSALFRYAKPGDKWLIPFAAVLSAINGIMIPAFAVVFGRVTADFSPDKSPEERRDAGTKSAILSLVFGLIISSRLEAVSPSGGS